MSINAPGPTPSAIDALDDALAITWRDGLRRTHSYLLVRRSCRCAQCVEELTGRPLLDPATIPEDIHPTAIDAVGHYAVRIVWSDGHGSGIFSFAHLRGLPADRGEART